MSLPLLKRFLIALDKYKWVGLITVTTAIGVSGIVALQPREAAVYIAEGILFGNRATVSFSTTGTQIVQQGQELSPDILLASSVLDPVAQKAKTTRQQMLKFLKVKIQEPKKDSKTGAETPFQVIIRYQADDPRQAVNIVNFLMEAMIEQSRKVNVGRLQATISALNQRLPKATQELRAAEGNLEQYDRTEGPALLAAQNGNLLSAITSSEQQQRQLELTLQGVDTQLSSLQQRLGLNPNQAYAASALSADPIIANLRTQIYQIESQIEILSKDLRSEHPTLIELGKRRQALEQMLQQRANEVIGGNNMAAPLSGGDQIRRDSSLDPARQQLANTLVELHTQREALQQQMVTLKNSEQQLRTAYATIPNKQLERTRLEQQVLLKRALYDKIQSALVDARAAEAETVSSLTATKSAQYTVDIKPSKNIPLILGVGVLLGFVGGGGIILLLSLLEGKFYTLEEVREALQNQDVPLLGVLPQLSGLDLDDEIPVITEADSPYIDFYERLRTNLRRVEGRKIKVLLFTSALASEGKTTTAYNLAIAAARAGMRTLVLEADLRSASHIKALNIAIDPDSLTEPLRYFGHTSDCIRLVPQIENLYILPSPGPQRRAAAILESSEIRRLLEDVRGRFDLVLVDAPPLSRCNDALLLEPLTDGIVLLTRPGYTESSLLTEVTDQLNNGEFQLIGAVINGADVSIRFLNEEEELEPVTEPEELYEEIPRVPTGVKET
ncbi:lipopolysaccharide biosynthesis [Leptolyngbya sp. 'hensonii']|uniref:GumC family protein n=1 Tax=Leptolyngbya sp. 'hensonii' TaxID=1922337 RepID=UPI00094FFC45|nr:AAA family ATPase [Leptolyngbya sp. 'hensonii']OLP17799.1 lipopolysaccharide biosynthesis [Leptolyngbya sp. 'hensonii']